MKTLAKRRTVIATIGIDTQEDSNVVVLLQASSTWSTWLVLSA